MPSKTSSKPNNDQVGTEDSEIYLVGIGASAGGLDAVSKLLGQLTSSTGFAFVVVQHQTPDQKSQLSNILATKTQMPVLESHDKQIVKPNHVYVSPPGMYLTYSNGALRLQPFPRHSHPKTIDHFFTSLSKSITWPIGVILSGTGSDGTIGLKAIKVKGGITFAQDPITAAFAEMPQSAILHGSIDHILSPESIAEELNNIGVHISNHILSRDHKSERVPSELDEMLQLLYRYSGVNFSLYRRPTITRRIQRRMILNQIETLKAYLHLLKDNSDEREALFQDLLIHVTAFFRNPDIYTTLKERVLPQLTLHRSPKQPIRIWVVGCATGEEAYSIAIILAEFFDEISVKIPVQIFATDVNESIITHARAGIYSDEDVATMSLDRLQRFFTKNTRGYQISKAIRDVCVFARHNVASDPPFAHLDMISCQNLLIYLEPTLQHRIIQTFHYALKSDGYLIIGPSETVGRFTNAFTEIDKNTKVYQKKRGVPITYPSVPQLFTSPEGTSLPSQTATHPPNIINSLQTRADEIVLREYAPAGVVINNDFDILQFRGQTGRYLEPAPGAPSFNLLKMIRAPLQYKLRLAINQAKVQQTIIHERAIHVQNGNHVRTITLEVRPLTLPTFSEQFYLILFNDQNAKQATVDASPESAPPKLGEETEVELEQVRRELRETREYLQSYIKEQGTTSEELNAAHEELQASYEELQSINEELETSKEELQATNEELNTLNEEYHHRNLELAQVSADLHNLINSTNIPIIIVRNDLTIREITPMATTKLHIHPSDVNRPINHIKFNLDLNNLDQLIREVLDTLTMYEQELYHPEGYWILLQIRPYITLEKKIEGAILLFFDITARKQLERTRLDTIRETATMVGHDLRNPLHVLNLALYVLKNNLTVLPEAKIPKQNLLKHIHSMEVQIAYMSKIISDLQDYSTPLHAIPQPTDLLQLINNTLSMVTIPDTTAVSVVIPPRFPEINVDPVMMKRVFHNLVLNAIQAMSAKGTLTIQASMQNKNLVVTVTDTGVGISRDNLEEIFQPFFTTKPKGQGLGLTVCKRLIEAQHGEITVTSKEQQGTTITLTIPQY